MSAGTFNINKKILLTLVFGLVLSGCDEAGNILSNGEQDTDGDGLTNAEELALGTSPDAADSDGDGFSDYVEVKDLGVIPPFITSAKNRRLVGHSNFLGGTPPIEE